MTRDEGHTLALKNSAVQKYRRLTRVSCCALIARLAASSPVADHSGKQGLRFNSHVLNEIGSFDFTSLLPNYNRQPTSGHHVKMTSAYFVVIFCGTNETTNDAVQTSGEYLIRLFYFESRPDRNEL